MATAVAVLNNFGTDSWKAGMYESLSLAARLSLTVEKVKTHGQNIKLSYLLWRINSHAAKFFVAVDDIISGKTPSEPVTEPPTPESIQNSINTLVDLGNSFSSAYERARRKRLLNNSLIAGPIMALRSNADQFFELAEWFELLRNSNDVDKIFVDARGQRNRGEVYDLSQVS
jgi:hypothetical protein